MNNLTGWGSLIFPILLSSSYIFINFTMKRKKEIFRGRKKCPHRGKNFLTLLDKSPNWWFNLIVEEGKSLKLGKEGGRQP